MTNQIRDLLSFVTLTSPFLPKAAIRRRFATRLAAIRQPTVGALKHRGEVAVEHGAHVVLLEAAAYRTTLDADAASDAVVWGRGRRRRAGSRRRGVLNMNEWIRTVLVEGTRDTNFKVKPVCVPMWRLHGFRSMTIGRKPCSFNQRTILISTALYGTTLDWQGSIRSV
uniref:Uncharacterized protein n=1 Tax=Steinernema glaseri TaxID=37863 RepID=A0A1I7ZPH2_9BILA